MPHEPLPNAPASGFLERLHNLRASNVWIFSTMLFSACISLTASLVLSIDALRIAKNPQINLSCDINKVISCGDVARTWQAQLLGFPNAYLGMMAEPVVITIAVASLTGVVFRRGFMLAAQCVYTIGVIFAYWLFFQSTFVIHALCPWCLLVTLSTTLVFTTLTHVNVRDNNLFLPPKLHAKVQAAFDLGLDLAFLLVWFAALFALEIARYGGALFS